MELSLRAYLEGLLAVLAYRERPRLVVAPGVFDAALHATLEATSKQAARERIRLRFRLSASAMSRKNSPLQRVLRALTRDGVIRMGPEGSPAAQVAWGREAAYARLAEDDMPVAYLERSGKIFVRQMEARRIQQNLRGLVGTAPRRASRD